MQHGCDVLCQCPVRSLCISVLLRPIARAVAPLNPTLVCEPDKRSRHVLPTLVVLQGLEFEPQGVLSPSLELPERVKGVAFPFKEQRNLEASAVINKDHPVAVPIACEGHRTAQVAVNELKRE